jgi:hypothetical protein
VGASGTTFSEYSPGRESYPRVDDELDELEDPPPPPEDELDELLELDPPPPEDEDEDDDDELGLGAVDDELDDDVLEVLGAGALDDPAEDVEGVDDVDEAVGPVGLSLSQAIEPSPMVIAPPLRRRRKSRRSERVFRVPSVSFFRSWSAMPPGMCNRRTTGGPLIGKDLRLARCPAGGRRSERRTSHFARDQVAVSASTPASASKLSFNPVAMGVFSTASRASFDS